MKPKNLFLFLTIILIAPLISSAQHTRQEVIWYGYFLTIPISETWYNVTEIQERHLIRPFQQSQFLVRTRFHKAWTKNWDTSVGFSAFLHHRQRPFVDDDFNWPEWRPHADITWKSKYQQLQIDQRIRGEARFYQRLDSSEQELESGFFFRGFRYRYRLQLSIPIASNYLSKSLQLKLANETMGMSGEKTGEFTFDQNRISADISYAVSPGVNLELGYIFLHQSIGSGRYLIQDILRITVRHQLKKRK